MPVSRRIEKDLIQSSKIRGLFEEGIRLKEIHGETHVADMSLGNPVFEPPAAFAQCVSRLVHHRGGMHRYMPNLGFPRVRGAVADKLVHEGRFDGLGPQHILMCSGAAAGMNVILKTILNPGENVVAVAPYFVEYRFYVENHGGTLTVAVAADDFSLDIDRIEAAMNSKTRAVIVNSPNNPSGAVYTKENLLELVEMLESKQRHQGQAIYVISDEPYRELVYEEQSFTSIASLYSNGFMVYSFSKSLSIPGERIGYVAIHPEMEDGQAIMNGMAICNRTLGFVNAPALMQRAIAEVQVDVALDAYRRRRGRIRQALLDGGYEFAKPQGAFYMFAKCFDEEKSFIRRAQERLLLVVPGSSFGYPGWFRIAYCVDDRTIELAGQKLREIAESFRS